MSEILTTENVYETIVDYLCKQGFAKQSDNIYVKDLSIPGNVMIINGQKVEGPAQKLQLTIEYLGEGAFYNVGEEEQPLYGFKFVNREDVWVDSLNDFEFWYTAFFGKLEKYNQTIQ